MVKSRGDSRNWRLTKQYNMTYYSLTDVQQIIDIYSEFEGHKVITLREGTLGDDLLTWAPKKKTVIIKCVYLNEWSSTYTIRKYNIPPKKYQDMLADILFEQSLTKQLDS